MSDADGVLLSRAELERAFTALGERPPPGVSSPMYSSWQCCHDAGLRCHPRDLGMSMRGSCRTGS